MTMTLWLRSGPPESLGTTVVSPGGGLQLAVSPREPGPTLVFMTRTSSLSRPAVCLTGSAFAQGQCGRLARAAEPRRSGQIP
jgi:hypothetical protein